MTKALLDYLTICVEVLTQVRVEFFREEKTTRRREREKRKAKEGTCGEGEPFDLFFDLFFSPQHKRYNNTTTSASASGQCPPSTRSAAPSRGSPAS